MPLAFVSVIDPEFPLPGDCTCAVTPAGNTPTLAVSAAVDPVRVTVIATAVAGSPENSVTVPLASVNANCGPLTFVPPLLPQPTASGNASKINPNFAMPVITTRKPTTKPTSHP